MRNKSEHGLQLTSAELRTIEGDTIDLIERMLFQCKWIRKYKLFRVSNVRPTKRAFVGRISFYMGYDEGSIGEDVVWQPRLLENNVYLSNRTGNKIVEVSPLIRYYEQRSDYLFLMESFPKMKFIKSLCDKKVFVIKSFCDTKVL